MSLIVIQWSSELSIGIDEIDGQHKELIKRLDNFALAVLRKDAKNRLDGLLYFMEDYTKNHFRCEEEFMGKNKYSGLEKHVKQHSRFMKVVQKLKLDLEKEGPSENMALSIQQFLIDWLILHIQDCDMKMGKFLQKHKEIEDPACEFLDSTQV